MNNTKTQHIALIHGYPCGLGAGNPGCGDGPAALRQAQTIEQLNLPAWQFHWQDFPTVPESDDKYVLISQLNQQLAQATTAAVAAGTMFLNLGGDQSMSVGTWSGAQAGLGLAAELGLIWVDAHMDGHTPDTSPTGNIHGMPLAALLGYGDQRLTSIAHDKPKLKPEHVCLIGIRSYEAGEKALLEKLGVRIFYIEEVLERGLQAVLSEAFSIAEGARDGFGISFDMDGLDPEDAPGVGTPVSTGIRLSDWQRYLPGLLQQATTRFVGLEVVEYNPHLDIEHKTRDSLAAVVSSVFAHVNPSRKGAV